MNESRHVDAAGVTETGGNNVPTAPGPFASFVRFVVCGGGVGLIASAAVPMVARVMPWTLANALITVVSTLLCTELHARITFGTGQRAGWRRHLQSAGSAAGSYAVTTAAVLVLHAVQPTAGALLEQAVYLGAAALAGIGRFVVLRVLVFAVGRDRTQPGADSRTPARRRVPASGARVPAPRRSGMGRTAAPPAFLH